MASVQPFGQYAGLSSPTDHRTPAESQLHSRLSQENAEWSMPASVLCMDSIGSAVPEGPRSLEDLKKGSVLDGDTGHSPMLMPPWLDMARCLKVHKFWHDHAASLGLAWHCSLVIGFSIPSLLEALVFTDASSTPQTALKRYMATGAALAAWHEGNIWDPADKGFASLQAVRQMHKGVRENMEQKLPGQKWVTMYDMPSVQLGFIGPPTVFSSHLGIRVSEDDLEDYVYFWKCVGYQLGIDDNFNACSLGKDTVVNITKEYESEILFPDAARPPPQYNRMASAYIDGLNLLTFGFPLFSIASSCAITYWANGKHYSLGFADTLRFYFLRFNIILFGCCPPFKRIFNKAMVSSFRQLGQRCNASDGPRQCPFSGAVAHSSVEQCPHVSARAIQVVPPPLVTRFNPLGIALLASAFLFLLVVFAFIFLIVLMGCLIQVFVLPILWHALALLFAEASKEAGQFWHKVV